MLRLLCKTLLLPTLLAYNAQAISNTAHSENSTTRLASHRQLDEPLASPTFDYDSHPVYQPCGNEVLFSYVNSNDGTATEIWRSRSNDTGFELVAVKRDEHVYLDMDLTSRKTYYYKLRAVTETDSSAFSETAGFESGAKWFDPQLEVDWMINNTVEVKLSDRSYLDYSYEIISEAENGPSTPLQRNIILSDSGKVFTFSDASAQPGTTYTYYIDAYLSGSCGSRLYSNVARQTISIPHRDLAPPEFVNENPGFEPCGNQIAFAFENANQDSRTEIWRSRYPDSMYEMAGTEDGGGGGFLDEDLVSRQTYYYKLRAVTAKDTSGFSQPYSFDAGPKWFDPILELKLLPDSTVQGRLTDRSFLDEGYDIISGNSPTGFLTSAIMKDSGRVFTFIDDRAQPGQTYTYNVGAAIPCSINYLENVATATITIPKDGPEGELTTPDLRAGAARCDNNISLIYDNVNEGSATELWRSQSPGSGFELIATEGMAGGYGDKDLGSRKTYYYKARAVTQTDTSNFSQTLALESGPQWFPPSLDLSISANNTVEGKLTDRSYLDSSYEILAKDVQTGSFTRFFAEPAMPDSGTVYSFTDVNVEKGKKYIYYVDANLSGACASTKYDNVAIDSITVPANSPEELVPPSFDLDHSSGYEPCGNEISFNYDNNNENADTEVWRSRYADSGFELVTSLSPGEIFVDRDLESQKTYYYKLKAKMDGKSSAFSETASFDSGAKWFDPTLEVELLPDSTVKGTLTDRSYLDAAYEIYWDSSPTGFFKTVFMQDSGSVFTFIDAAVQPGQTYTYKVNAILDTRCRSAQLFEVAQATISTPNEDETAQPSDTVNEKEIVNIFPNPAESVATVELPATANREARVILIDSQGKEFETDVTDIVRHGVLTKELNIKSLAPGLYLLKVVIEGKIITRRVVIK